MRLLKQTLVAVAAAGWGAVTMATYTCCAHGYCVLPDTRCGVGDTAQIVLVGLGILVLGWVVGAKENKQE